jgi:RimJ/RimL family protein N-acetyltransferase
MERLPYRSEPDGTPLTTDLAIGEVATTDWRDALPVLTGTGITLRELRRSDAPTLLAMLATDEVSRFISPPPTTVEGFERFIAWTHAERAAGRYICFGIVPDGWDTAVGILQVRQLDARFDVAEWGFVLGQPFWGTGLFLEGAKLTVNFAFDTLGVQRLEARSSTTNGRGNGALRKLGAVLEGTLRQSFARHGSRHDQHLWAILPEDWREARASWGVRRITIH